MCYTDLISTGEYTILLDEFNFMTAGHEFSDDDERDNCIADYLEQFTTGIYPPMPRYA